jgi:hypothetical protein
MPHARPGSSNRPSDIGAPTPNTLRDQAQPNVVGVSPTQPEPTRLERGRPGAGQGVPGPVTSIRSQVQELLHRAFGTSSRGSSNGPIEDVPGVAPEANAHESSLANRMLTLARSFLDRSEAREIELLDNFRKEAALLAPAVGELVIRDARDERMVFLEDGSFGGEVMPQDEPSAWLALTSPSEIVAFYDPSVLLADLATAIRIAHPSADDPTDVNAGPRLRQLAEAFAERGRWFRDRSVAAEVGLLEEFERAAAPLARITGDMIFLDGPDERLTLEHDGRLRAEVVPDDEEGGWRTLRTSIDLTEFYSPEEVFGRLADELKRTFPADPGPHKAVTATGLRDLALAWREESLAVEAELFAEFARASAPISAEFGEFVIVDAPDQRLLVDPLGRLMARVLDESTGRWRKLSTAEELVDSYDPTDVFSDLQDALIEAFPDRAGADAQA